MKEINHYKFCIYCGTANSPEANFCQKCGCAMNPEATKERVPDLPQSNAEARPSADELEERQRLGATILRLHRFSRQLEESLPPERRRARECFEEGVKHYDAEEYEQAIACFKKAGKLGEPEAFFGIGVIYDSITPEFETDLSKALSYYLRAKRRGMMSSELFYHIAILYRKQLNLRQATRYYQMSRACAENDFAELEILQAQVKRIRKAEKRLKLGYMIVIEAAVAFVLFLLLRS